MFCDLFVSTNKQHILPAPLRDLLEVLKTHLASNTVAMLREGGRLSYFISDIVFDDEKKWLIYTSVNMTKTVVTLPFQQKNKPERTAHA